MGRMARNRGSDRTGALRSRAGAVLLAFLIAAGLGASGCSGDSSDDEPPPAATPVALRVTSVEGAERLGERARSDLEAEVGDVLSGYIVQGFLGDYPREDFVDAFDAFTGDAARSAATDIDLLTGARYRNAKAVRAARLDARLSFLVVGADVIGATAGVRFGFSASLANGEVRPVRLRGRLMLVEDDGTWSVFGYDVLRDDGGMVQSGETS